MDVPYLSRKEILSLATLDDVIAYVESDGERVIGSADIVVTAMGSQAPLFLAAWMRFWTPS